MGDVLRVSVYVLCALTSIVCAVMLLRGYLRSRSRLLLWSSLCFIGFGVNNLLLMIDRVFYPEVTFFPAAWRSGAALLGLCVLIYGLIFDVD